MISDIRNVLRSSDSNKIADLYTSISGRTLDRNCGSCIADAKIYLQAKILELERENSPIHLYILSPSEETLWQNQNNPAVNKLVVVESPVHAFSLFEPEVVNVICRDSFFDSTLSAAKQIKPYQAYAIDCYGWNGNGHARLLKGIPCAWVFRGKIRRQINDLSELSKTGYVISNPFDIIHALRLTE